MAKKGKRGRPKSANPLSAKVQLRIDADMQAALATYQKKYIHDAELRTEADVARHIIAKALRAEGMLR